MRNTYSDGYLVVARWATFFLDALGKNDVPLIFLDHSGDGSTEGYSQIWFNTYETIYRGIRHFIDSGYNRIAILVPAHEEHATNRFRQLYERSLKELGLEYSKVIFGGNESAATMAAMRNVLAGSDRPDALFVLDYQLMPDVGKWMKADNIRPGHDLGLIHFAYANVIGRPECHWSRYEFDMEMFGMAVVGNLMRIIQVAGTDRNPIVMSVHPIWRPGQTHLKLA